MTSEPNWREGYRILAASIARLPEALRQTAAGRADPIDFDPREVRSFVVTGVGSSAAHARFLRHHLAVLGLPVRFASLSEFAAGPAGSQRDVLVVFSQGISPNARLALAEPRRWKKVILGTGVRSGLEELEGAGVVIRRFADDGEHGTLVRMIGPLCGHWTALELARDLGAAAGRSPLPAIDVAVVCERVGAATESDVVAEMGWLDDDVALLTSGSYGELVGNLRYKLLEACLRPMPPVWDLLEVAHGPFQEAVGKRRSFLALTRAGAPAEAELLARLREMLDPERHRVIVYEAKLPAPYSIFEHEAMLDRVCLRFIEERRLDQVRWPGRGADRPLYAMSEPLVGDRREGEGPRTGVVADRTPRGPHDASLAGRRLDLLSWREVERLIAAGCRTAVVPLGATEQHGAHLPLAADTWIADALAERFCARVPDAVRLPALGLGCSPEHLDFPGTLSLARETLAAVLEDVLGSLRRHGFGRVFLFTAHGGNVTPLREALPGLRRALRPLRVDAFVDLDRVTEALWREAAACGVAPAAAGHHAGELETSILLALAPWAVRREELTAGRCESAADAQSLFYPTLRPNAPGGTLGDPRLADAVRAERYLSAWVDLLVETHRESERKSACSTG
jgi:creatinine amidohydrolase